MKKTDDKMPYAAERREVAYFLRRLYKTGLTTTSGGNVSLRIGRSRVAVTASALDKARVKAAQISILKLDGTNLTAELKPSSECLMHLRIYAARPEIRAVVHAHPPTATAFTTATTPIRTDLIAESHCLLGRVALSAYHRTNTVALADAVADAARTAECILMENHGVTTLGATLLQAFDRMELLEQAAKMTLLAQRLEGVHGLTDGQKRELDEMMAEMPNR